MTPESVLQRRVAINAQFQPGGFVGGVEQFVGSLVTNLGSLGDGDERYVVVALPGFERHPEFRSGPSVTALPGFVRAGRRFRLVELLPPRLFRALKRSTTRPHRAAQAPGVPGPVLPDGAFFDALGAGVVHFPFQNFFRTSTPSIFHPHDLQHLHFPRFFTADELATRDRVYPAACAAARAVVVEARWVKNDVCRSFGIADEKILVIPIGPPKDRAVSSEGAPKSRRGLPERFILYPAQAWPHKNHLTLLEALRLLRDRDGILVGLVCTGRKTSFWPTIAECVRNSRMSDVVRFAGYVDREELAGLYREATAVVLPSLCEGAGQPLLEAFSNGAAVACSGTTSFAEYAADAALLFNPEEPAEIAAAIRHLVTEPELRERLRSAGRARLAAFSWERSARAYRALYRELAGWPMDASDHALLREARS
jgi:glycosyltransferase involved in cell wall biosynthesis